MLYLPLRLSRILITISALAPSLARAEIKAQFAGTADLAQDTSKTIVRAKHHVDAILPDLSDPVVTDALTAAAQKGHKTRIITTAAAVAAAGKHCRRCDELELAGIDLRTVDYKLLERVVIVDGPRSPAASGVLGQALVISAGLGEPGADKSLVRFEREGSFLLSFQNEFNLLWSKAKDYDDASTTAVAAVKAPLAPFVQFSSANLVALETEDGFLFKPSVEHRTAVLNASLLTAINQAYDSIDLSAARVRSPEMYGALKAALARGVRVRMVLASNEFQEEVLPRVCANPKTKIKSPRFDECLAALGAAVRYAPAGLSLDSQYLVIDGKSALAGQLAWSRHGEWRSLGLLLTLRGAPVQTYVQRFETVYTLSASPFRRPAVSPYLVAKGEVQEATVSADCIQKRPISYSLVAIRKLQDCARMIP